MAVPPRNKGARPPSVFSKLVEPPRAGTRQEGSTGPTPGFLGPPQHFVSQTLGLGRSGFPGKT